MTAAQKVETLKSPGYATGAIASGATNQTAGVNIEPFSTGLFKAPADLNGDTITFKVSNELGGTYSLVDAANATLTGVTGQWLPIPASVMTGKFLKVVTGTATAGAIEIEFLFK